jgi:hypothetical protein
MIRLADFDVDMSRKVGGNSQPRAENFEDERVARLDQFHAPTETDAERFEPLHFLIVRLDIADDRTNTRRELIQPDEGNCGLA